MNTIDLVSRSPKERIDGVTFGYFQLLPPQEQRVMLAQWSERAAQWMQAGTLPVRLKGQALALKLTQWARAAGVQL